MKTLYERQISGTSADLREVIAHEVASRSHRSSQLEVLEYEPCEHSVAHQLLKTWHLLFFARAGEGEMQELQRGLLEESTRDEHLIKQVRKIQEEYRQYTAMPRGNVTESLEAEAVIGEIYYGSLVIAPGFWLPEDMQMGLSLLPSTGGRLAPDAFTLVEHYLNATSASLDVLMITASLSHTKAELAASQSVPGDGLDLRTPPSGSEKESIPFILALGYVALAVTARVTRTAGFSPPSPDEEDSVGRLAEQVRTLGLAPSASQLIQARQLCLAGKVSKA